MKKISAVLLLILSVLLMPASMYAASATPSGSSRLSFVEDSANLLSDSQWRALETHAEAIAQAYPCEVRIITVDNMRDFGYYDVEEFSYDLYVDYALGYGPGRDCLLFVLSMRDRDYDFRVWGAYGGEAFTLYGMDTMLDRHILPLLRNNDYYNAFSTYLDTAEAFLQMAEEGRPFDRDTDPVALQQTFHIKLAIVLLAPLLCALLLCSIWKAQMKTAHIAGTAFNYIPAGGLRLSNQSDIYLFRTVSRTKIQSSSSGRASSGGRGGSSGRSGKF